MAIFFAEAIESEEMTGETKKLSKFIQPLRVPNRNEIGPIYIKLKA